MLAVDDILLFPFAIFTDEAGIPLLSPNLLMMSFKALRDQAFKDLYPLEKTQQQIKENRMLFEFGEISRRDYVRKHVELTEKLKMAKKVREMNLDARVNIFG